MNRSMVGGSACPPSLITAFDERYQVRIIQGWGMTEMSPVGTLSNPPHASEGEERFSYRASQGRLLPGVQGRLMGPDGSEVPWDAEAVGELEVKGPWITGSYYVAPGEEPTADALSKFSDDGWLRTGDVGSLSPNGYLRLTDRAKDVIKSGGEWISSVDLENALMGHPKVAEASVVGVPDDKWGERPLATVVVAAGPGGRRGGAARLPGRQGGALAAAGAVGVHRGGAQDQRRQVRQEGAAAPVRRRRARGHHALTEPRLRGPSGEHVSKVCRSRRAPCSGPP